MENTSLLKKLRAEFLGPQNCCRRRPSRGLRLLEIESVESSLGRADPSAKNWRLEIG